MAAFQKGRIEGREGSKADERMCIITYWLRQGEICMAKGHDANLPGNRH